MTERVLLHIEHWHRDGADVRDGLSAARLVDGTLFVACDETAAVEALRRRPDGGFGAHAYFPLAELIDLPGKPDGEADIEGLAHEDGHLWLVGSHSRKRKKPKPGMDAAKALSRLAKVKADANRFLLARLPLAEAEGGLRPVRDGAARLAGDAKGNALTRALARDPHLKAFLRLPGKDNGLDIEGLAVRGGRVLLGLRGPVLRGWAVVLEIQPAETAPGVLNLQPFPDGRTWRKHLLDLDGLGVRDLCLDGDDVLVLAGPTMDLPGPFVLHRWRGGPAHGRDGDDLVAAEALPVALRLPHHDHKPEGMTLLGDGRLLTVYDEPGEGRKPAPGVVAADVFRLDPDSERQV